MSQAAKIPVFCPVCAGPLELVQPLRDEPRKILAACAKCRVWYIDLAAVKVRDLSGPHVKSPASRASARR